jgi:hypothetical protein
MAIVASPNILTPFTVGVAATLQATDNALSGESRSHRDRSTAWGRRETRDPQASQIPKSRPRCRSRPAVAVPTRARSRSPRPPGRSGARIGRGTSLHTWRNRGEERWREPKALDIEHLAPFRSYLRAPQFERARTKDPSTAVSRHLGPRAGGSPLKRLEPPLSFGSPVWRGRPPLGTPAGGS